LSTINLVYVFQPVCNKLHVLLVGVWTTKFNKSMSLVYIHC